MAEGKKVLSTKRKVIKSLGRILIALVLLLAAGWWYVAQPSFSSNQGVKKPSTSSGYKSMLKNSPSSFTPAISKNRKTSMQPPPISVIISKRPGER